MRGTGERGGERGWSSAEGGATSGIGGSIGLYHVRHRVYDPLSGRWLSRDPAGFIDGMNLYEYVMSGPVGAWDPWGLWLEGIATEMMNSGNRLVRAAGYAVGVIGGAAEGAVEGGKNVAVGAATMVQQAAYNAVDTVGMAAEVVTGGALSYTPIGELGQASQHAESWADVAAQTGIIASRAGGAIVTAGASEVVIGIVDYARTGDAEALSQHMGGIAGANLVGPV